MSFSISTCCFCQNECNPLSQSCGRCARYISTYGYEEFEIQNNITNIKIQLNTIKNPHVVFDKNKLEVSPNLCVFYEFLKEQKISVGFESHSEKENVYV